MTARLIEDGRAQQVLTTPLPLPFPVRPDLQLTLVKGAEHRWSTPDCRAMIAQAVKDIANRAA